jgi:hypothetical protein
MRLDWSSPRSFAWLRSAREGRAVPVVTDAAPGWWRRRRRTASPSQPCRRVRHCCAKSRAGRGLLRSRSAFRITCPSVRTSSDLRPKGYRAGHGERQTSNGCAGRQSQAARHQPDGVCLPAPHQVAAGLGPGVERHGGGRCVTNTLLKEEVWCCTRDEGGSLGAGGQAKASNHCKLLSSRAMVVSVAAKGGTRSRQV